MVFLCFFENYFNKSPLQTQLKMDSRKMHNKFDYFMILQSLQLSALASKARRKMSFLFITRLLIVCAEEGEIFHDYNAIKSPDLQCFYLFHTRFCVQTNSKAAKKLKNLSPRKTFSHNEYRENTVIVRFHNTGNKLNLYQFAIKGVVAYKCKLQVYKSLIYRLTSEQNFMKWNIIISVAIS